MTTVNKTQTINNDSINSTASTFEGNQRKLKLIKWTKEEERILLNCIKDNPGNLQNAFRKASELLPLRSWRSCAMRWYTVLSQKEGNNSVVMMCISSKRGLKNRKNIRGNTIKDRKTWSTLWKSITKLFKEW